MESRPRYKNASNETQYPIALSTRIVNSEPDFANSEYRSEIALVTSWPSLVFLGKGWGHSCRVYSQKVTL